MFFIPEASRTGVFAVLTAADAGLELVVLPVPVPAAAADAALIRAVFSLIVAESTVFCRLKLLVGVML